MSATFRLGQVLEESVDDYFTGFGRLLRLAWKPLLLIYVCGFILGFVQVFTKHPIWVTDLLGRCIIILFSALFLLAVHRYQIVGWNDATKRVHVRLRSVRAGSF
jgi:hypothetical protein